MRPDGGCSTAWATAGTPRAIVTASHIPPPVAPMRSFRRRATTVRDPQDSSVAVRTVLPMERKPMGIVASLVDRYRGQTRLYECRRCGTTLEDSDGPCRVCGGTDVAVYDL